MRARLIAQIRRANQRDAAAIELLIRESFREHEPAYTREAFDIATPKEHEIEKRIKEWAAVWVAINANVIVGTVSAHAQGPALHIRSMAVHPSTRGRGIGKLLLEQVEDFACANGYKRLILNTTPFMNRAIRLYKAFGFEFTGTEQNWFGTRLRAMAKELPANNKDQKGREFMLQNAAMYSYIPAKNVARARAFYEEKLGLKPKEITAGGVTYEFAKGTACFLYPTPNAGTSKASQAFWQVEDLEKEVAELMARGVEFEKYDMPDIDEKGISTAGGAKAAWFRDTEGNIMALIQTL
jgi:ribosomal protein S18 acetylase RimI-like enzyme/catechol 2,3-dioxygenase-like lactoylglutathione lyase family enzyme